jgi:hypothetical protein
MKKSINNKELILSNLVEATVSDLAFLTGLSKSTIQRHLNELHEDGSVSIALVKSNNAHVWRRVHPDDAKGAKAKLILPDHDQCQSLIPNGNTFMTLGGRPGWNRCLNKPVVIAKEKTSSVPGTTPGSMSLCAHCANKFLSQDNPPDVTFEFIEKHDVPADDPKHESKYA